ncbi:hypothetical protein RchiOBHm_Chr7g0222911 [Rosa chinensis]|uniref:Uncharacterized protein n=1 Tax=Rosa chinensis TaxID=74649 RepID=A0A2P6PDE9_ROSCH|nr:hypothetical protein RchiOBHm_Chr7g0222911 [Rosa chinensis]
MKPKSLVLFLHPKSRSSRLQILETHLRLFSPKTINSTRVIPPATPDISLCRTS